MNLYKFFKIGRSRIPQIQQEIYKAILQKGQTSDRSHTQGRRLRPLPTQGSITLTFTDKKRLDVDMDDIGWVALILNVSIENLASLKATLFGINLLDVESLKILTKNWTTKTSITNFGRILVDTYDTPKVNLLEEPITIDLNEKLVISGDSNCFIAADIYERFSSVDY